MKKFNLKYFLASNSCEGFVSDFDNCYNPLDNWKAYIIKGGPGTGKSSFMKYLAAKAEEKNIKTVLCPCSSDPNSLDGVIISDIKTVILDGTAPHTLDPVLPGVCEEILNFGQFWETEELETYRNEIISVTKENKNHHKSASKYFKSAGALIYDNLNLSLTFTDKEKVTQFAKKLCKKHIPAKRGNSYEWVRYLGGLTPKGVVAFGGTALDECENAVIIDDRFGSVSSILFPKIKEYALNNGYEIITVKNPFLPSALIDGIIIPELSLAFLREYDYMHLNTDVRRIHARRFINATALSRQKNHLKLNEKIVKQLLILGCNCLNKAKTVHDELEKYYISAMDFKKLTAFAEDFANKLFEN